MKKKILLIITALTLMLSGISVSATPKLTDIEDVSGKNEIELLYNLGIVEGNDEGEFMPEASVKRIEFAVMILRMLKMDEFAMEGEFADIPSTHWAYNYAGTLKSMGIVEGIGDNKFGIDMNVTYEQALKMLVSALGYSNIAEQQGGYPNGYLAMATTLGITDDVPMSTGAVNRLSAALLIENCLEADMLKPGQEDTKNPDNILEDTLRYTKMRGTVDATFDAYGSENLKYNEIVISGVRYKLDIENCIIDTTGLFGRQVEYYVTERDYEEVISHIRPVGQAVESITVDADDIATTTTKTQFNYYKNDKLESETIETPTNVYYNGRQLPASGITNAIMKPADGSVTIIDLDNNGSYETVQIREYKTKVVSRATDTAIYATYGGNLDLEKYEHVEIYHNGNEVTMSDIEPGDVLSVSTDKEGESASIIISREYIDGKITRTRTTSRGVQLCGMESGEYAIDKAYKSAADSNSYGVDKISIGTEGRFYLTAYGKIANYEKVTIADDGEEVTGSYYTRKNDMLYGYLWSSKLVFDGEDMLVMSVLTEKNKYENIVVNGEARFGRRTGGSYSYKKETAQKIYEVVGGVKQMIAYKLGDDGYVEGLCLADTASNDDYFCKSVPAGDQILYSNKVFDRRYYVDQDTVVFSTPHQSTYYSYNVVGKYNDIFSNGTWYVVSLYDVSEDGRVGAIHYNDGTITKYTSTTGGNEIYIDPTNSPVLYVTGVTTGLVDDEEVTVISGIESGKEVERVLSKTLLSASEDPNLIMAGAVIQYETNDLKIKRAENSELREEIVLFKHVLNLNNDNPYKTTFGYEDSLISRMTEATNLTDTGLTISYAYIKGVTPNAINIQSNRAITLLKNSGIKVMHYDRESQMYTPKSLDDLQAGMDVFVRQRLHNAIEIVYFD